MIILKWQIIFPFAFFLVDGSVVLSVAPNNQVACLPQTESIPQEPLNLSGREKPRSPVHKANGRIPSIVSMHRVTSLLKKTIKMYLKKSECA